MRRAANFYKKHPGGALLAGCYLLGIAIFLMLHLAGFIQNRVAYATGALAPARLTLADFEPNDELIEKDGVLISIGSDPQLRLKDPARRVENLNLTATYSRPPLVQQVFWAAPGQDHSLRKTAYAQDPAATEVPTAATGAVTTTFSLPPGGGQSLRLDPAAAPGVAIGIQDITVNQKRPFYAFFAPAAGELALLAALPGLFACALALLGQAVRLKPRAAKKNEPGAKAPTAPEGSEAPPESTASTGSVALAASTTSAASAAPEPPENSPAPAKPEPDAQAASSANPAAASAIPEGGDADD